MSSRVFLIHHGETDWTVAKRYMSSTDVPMSKRGENQVEITRELDVGAGKLIDPRGISRIYIAPLQRSRRTAEILRLGVNQNQHFYDRTTKTTETMAEPPAIGEVAQSTIQVTGSLQEWDYGEYEGMTLPDILQKRKQQGLDKERQWSIWEDGCPGGEGPESVENRVDELINEIKSVIGSTSANWPGGQSVTHASDEPRNVVCIGPGQTLVALAFRWIGQPLKHAAKILMEPAGVAVLGFEDEVLQQPVIFLGRKPAYKS